MELCIKDNQISLDQISTSAFIPNFMATWVMKDGTSGSTKKPYAKSWGFVVGPVWWHHYLGNPTSGYPHALHYTCIQLTVCFMILPSQLQLIQYQIYKLQL